MGLFPIKAVGAVLAIGIIFSVAVYPLRAADDAITFVVTKDFARPPLAEKKVPAAGGSCMDILKESADVETGYAGSFVLSIDGTGGNDRNRAWFYYVNGLLADVGASGYVPRPGDVIQWDYHSWGSSKMVSALIGAYPQPFLSDGCSILHAPGWAWDSGRFAGALKECGATNISVISLDTNKNALPEGHVILVGAIGDIQKTKGFGDVIQRATRLLESHGVGARDPGSGCPPPGTGAICSFKDGWGRTARALWLVTGTDDEGVLRALEVLIARPREIEYLPGAVVTAEGVRNAPAP